VLTGSVGDLVFYITVNTEVRALRIYVPGEFTFTRTEDAPFSVWTDITNDYGFIGVSARGSDDAIAPNWNRITIGAHGDLSGWQVIQPGTWTVRIFGLKAPETFGVYHFKIFYSLDASTYVSVPVEDYPIIIVKGELNPAYIIGTVDAATGLSGKVTATGTTADGRTVNGQFYFSPFFEEDSSGTFDYYLIGAPAGTYEVSATATGYTADTSDRFTVAAGQSTHGIDLSPSASPTISFTVFSKHGRGEIPWNCLYQPPYGTNNVTYLAANGACDGPWGTGLRDLYIHLMDKSGTEIGLGATGVAKYTGLDPTASSYSGVLPNGIEWAGVPSDSAAAVAGFETGKTYQLGLYVTGYVMTDTDAYQRTFTISGDEMQVSMDLRRSNWFVIQGHTITPKNKMGLGFFAADSAGNAKGLAAYDVPAGTDAPPIILEGWNGVSDSSIAGYLKDYGLDPGTYTITMEAADGTAAAAADHGTGWWYIKSDQPTSGSIALCNSPSSMSFDVGSVYLTLTLRSVDWEAPAHARAWTFPGADIWVNFLDSSGTDTGEAIAPTVDYPWGLVQDDYWADGTPMIGSPYLGPEGTHTITIVWTGNNEFAADILGASYPTHLAPGQYSFAVHTLGYVTKHVFPVWVPTGGNGDIQADLIQGGELRVLVHFTKEGQDVPFNGYIRAELFDKDNNLVAANIYGQAQPNPDTTVSGTGSYYDYDPAYEYMAVKDPAEGSMADGPWTGSTGAASTCDVCGQRGFTSMGFYGQPSATWADWANTNPNYANWVDLPAGEKQAFDLFGFYWYYGGAASRNVGLWANGWVTTDGVKQNDAGIVGSNDIVGMTGAGPYTLKVWAFDHVEMASFYADPVTGISVPWGGAQTITLEEKQMGRISGTPTWLDMYGNMRNMPWASFTTGENVASSTSQALVDWGIPGITDANAPSYFLWLPAGTYDLAVAASGPSQSFAPAGSTIVVSDGFSATYDQTMTPSGVPVPEFPATAIALLSALSASVYLLRRRRK